MVMLLLQHRHRHPLRNYTKDKWMIKNTKFTIYSTLEQKQNE